MREWLREDPGPGRARELGHALPTHSSGHRYQVIPGGEEWDVGRGMGDLLVRLQRAHLDLVPMIPRLDVNRTSS